MEEELLDWKCSKRGHVMGQMRRTSQGRMILLLYREAVDPRHPGKKPPDVIGVLYGTMIGVTCSVPGCGKRRTWGKEDGDAKRTDNERSGTPVRFARGQRKEELAQ
jgi:hypothetical protein